MKPIVLEVVSLAESKTTPLTVLALDVEPTVSYNVSVVVVGSALFDLSFSVSEEEYRDLKIGDKFLLTREQA